MQVKAQGGIVFARVCFIVFVFVFVVVVEVVGVVMAMA